MSGLSANEVNYDSSCYYHAPTTPTIFYADYLGQLSVKDSEEMQQERRQEASTGDSSHLKSKVETVGDYYETAKKYSLDNMQTLKDGRHLKCPTYPF